MPHGFSDSHFPPPPKFVDSVPFLQTDVPDERKIKEKRQRNIPVAVERRVSCRRKADHKA